MPNLKIPASLSSYWVSHLGHVGYETGIVGPARGLPRAALFLFA